MRRGQLERPLPADGYPEDGVTLRRIIRDGERDVEFSVHGRARARRGRLLLRQGPAGERRHGLVEPGLGGRLPFALMATFAETLTSRMEVGGEPTLTVSGPAPHVDPVRRRAI